MNGIIDIELEKPDLADYQKDFLYNDARFTFVEASTKAGKTFAMLWWIFERAHKEWGKPTNHWWVAPVYSQSNIAFTRLKRRILGSGLYKINESSLTVICPNGAVISFKSSDNPSNLYGDDVYSIVFDEAPRAKVSAWYALRSTITATGGVIKMIGNFGGFSNWMHQLKEKSKTDSEYEYFKITAWDAVEAGILDREEILQAKKDLPKPIFDALYLAEGSFDPNQLISNENIAAIFTNDHVQKGQRYITADIARLGSDKAIILVWEGWKIIDYVVFDKSRTTDIQLAIQTLRVKYVIPKHNCIADEDGVGGGVVDNCGIRGFLNGGKVVGKENYLNLQTQCIYYLASKINENEVYFEADLSEKYKGEIIEELEQVKSYQTEKDGKIRVLPKAMIKENIGRSPDWRDSLMMRSIFDLESSGSDLSSVAAIL